MSGELEVNGICSFRVHSMVVSARDIIQPMGVVQINDIRFSKNIIS